MQINKNFKSVWAFTILLEKEFIEYNLNLSMMHNLLAECTKIYLAHI